MAHSGEGKEALEAGLARGNRPGAGAGVSGGRLLLALDFWHTSANGMNHFRRKMRVLLCPFSQ